MEDIKLVMAKQGMVLSMMNIRKIIKNEGYKFRKARKVLTSNDPDYLEKFSISRTFFPTLVQKKNSSL
jgi:hypothetical protein